MLLQNDILIFTFILQIEVHPYLTQKTLASLCADNDIHITAYSPLSNPTNPFRADVPFVLDDAKVKEIAAQYDKTPAQVLIRYQVITQTLKYTVKMDT